ncbi:MAG: amidohydrolase family protein [Desulfomonilaceae bacterium]
MKTIAIEEHFVIPKLLAAKRADGKSMIGVYVDEQKKTIESVFKKMLDLGEGRLADMDAAGIDMQVLQFSGHFGGMDKDVVTSLSRESNDVLAEAIRSHPDRFSGLAQLPMHDPEKAAAELERCVNRLGLKGAVWSGICNGLFLDDPSFSPVLAEAERLDVPFYIHPGEPPVEIFEEYFSGLPGVAATLAMPGWGWHVEMGLHSYRLILSGVFDRFPKLQIIIGHMGENIPYTLARADDWLSPLATNLQRRVADYFRTNFYINTSGYFTVPPLLCALEVIGADRIMFGVDYPYSPNPDGRKFLDSASAHLKPGDLVKITHKNAERVFRL